MATREEIKASLARARDALLINYKGLGTEELERACTQSEAEDGAPWRAQDHLAHLALIERNFQQMVRRTVEGAERPIALFAGKKSRDEILAAVHAMNEDNVRTHRESSVDDLLADLDAVRADTLALLDELTDEQMAVPVPGAPWGDGTIGGVLKTLAGHEHQHWAWVEEGLAAN